MSFAVQETSVDQGEPILLYQFRFGPTANDVVGYTDNEQSIVRESVTYTAVPIDCGEISASGSLDKATLSIQLFEGAGITDLFRKRPPSSIVTVIIYQGHANDVQGQFLVTWTGRITSFSIDAEANTTELTGEPIATSMRRSGLRQHWQYGCPHILYGPRCRASKMAASSNHVVLAVNGAMITLSPTWKPDARKPKYNGGYAQFTLPDGRNELRTIIRTENDGRVLLSSPPGGLDPGESVTMVLGCNHKAGVGPQLDGDCAPLHNNILNFGGDMWIPYKNPIGLRNNYY